MSRGKSIQNGLLVLGVLITLWLYQVAAAERGGDPMFTVAGNPPVVGQPFTISLNTIDENDPSVAYNPVDHEYLVVWNNYWSANIDIYAQRISEQGKLLSWFYVADGASPSVAYNPKNNTYLIAFEILAGSDYDIYAQRVDFTGPLGSPFPIAFNLNHTEHDPAVSYNTHPNHDEFLIVWENITPPPAVINKIEGMRVAGTANGGDAGGETIGSRLPIADNGNYNLDPDIAYNLNRNEFMVVYTRQPGGGGSYDVFARRVTANGDLLPETVIDGSGNDQDNPSVAAYRLNHATPYLVVFNDTWNDPSGDVRGYLVDGDGQPNTLINIADTQGQHEFDPAIAQSEPWGGYLVTWIQGPSGDHDIFGRRVSDIGFTEPQFDISGTSNVLAICNRREPDIALGNAAALAIWEDPCGSAGGFDIVGRMLGYQLYLPLAVR